MTVGNPETVNPYSPDGDLYKSFATDRYPTWKMLWEGLYLSITILLWIKLINVTVSDHYGPLPTVIGFIVAQFLVDFMSGVAHWAGDTWGTFKTPIFGSTVIGPFRMHHVDPQDITIHGFM